MKKYILAISVLIFAVSCNNTSKNKVESMDSQTAASNTEKILTVDINQSVIHWKGTKVGGAHDGTLNLKSGYLTLNGEEVVSGSFIIDMNSIVDKDLTDQKLNDMLVKHLKSEDFFDVVKYPESSFTVTNIQPAATPTDSISHMISGNLKLKDVDKNITFGGKISKDGETYKAVTTPFSIDRTKWNVKYGSKTLFPKLTDNLVDDYIELQITIVATAAQ